MEMIPKVNKHVSLEGKVAMITGAASGIGLATAKRLSEVGACVALIDINKNVGIKEESQLQLQGRKARFFPCDVTSSIDCKKATDAVIQEFEKIDILFNNAGLIRRKNTVDLTEEEWDLVINVNLKSIYLLSHEVIPHMISRGGGTIINTGSGWGLKGGPEAVAYCAAKGGIVNITRAMAIDHGKHNIRVNCVCPGDVDTPLLHSEIAQLGFDESDFLKDAADRPLGRIGLPEDVANAVLYLSSEMSSWVSGAILLVDGGGLA